MTRRPAVLLIALSLGLGACGGSGGGSGSSASAATFCSLIKVDAKKFSDTASSDAQALAAFQKIERAAPSDIKPDMQTLVSFVKDVSTKQVPSASDFTKIESATKNIEAYVKDKCKFDLAAS
jgi:hypothetical protein